jgi:hypothetical protein
MLVYRYLLYKAELIVIRNYVYFLNYSLLYKSSSLRKRCSDEHATYLPRYCLNTIHPKLKEATTILNFYRDVYTMYAPKLGSDV